MMMMQMMMTTRDVTITNGIINGDVDGSFFTATVVGGSVVVVVTLLDDIVNRDAECILSLSLFVFLTTGTLNTNLQHNNPTTYIEMK